MSLASLGSLSQSTSDEYEPAWNRGTETKPRWIRPPRPRLKAVQRLLLERVLSEIPHHPAAFAGSGTGGSVAAARRHLSNRYLLHLDLKKFFPSVAPRRVHDGLVSLGMRQDTAALITGLVTVDDQLPQGAPTSPAIAEVVLRPFDVRMSGLAQKQSFVYTRYVDDIALSGHRMVEEMGARLARVIIAKEGWETNQKGGVYGPGARKELLGLNVGNTLRVPASYRSSIRSRLRLAADGRIHLRDEEWRRVLGQIAWVFVVNPRQGRRLRHHAQAVDRSRSDG